MFREMGDTAGEMDCLRILVGVLRLEGRLQEAVRMAEEELEMAQDAEAEANMLLTLAELGGKVETAIGRARQARELFRDVDRRKEGLSVLALVPLYRRQSKGREAAQAANEALSLFRGLEDRRGEACALHALATVSSKADAAKAARKAAAIFGELGLQAMEAREVLALAGYDSLIATAQEALSLCKGEAGEAAALTRVVKAYIENKDADMALSESEEALQRLQGGMGQATCLDLMTQALLAKGELSEAAATAERALASVRQLRDPRWETTLLQTLAQISVDHGQLEEAAKTLADAMSVLRAQGELAGEASVALKLAQAHAAKGEYHRALAVATQAMMVFQREGDRKSEGIAKVVLGDVFQLMSAPEDALTVLKEARGIFQAIGELKLYVKAVHAIASVQLGRNVEEAVRLALEAQKVAQKVADPPLEVEMLDFVAQAHLALMGQLLDEGAPRNSRFVGLWEKAHKAAYAAVQLPKVDALSTARCWYTVCEVNMIGGRPKDALQAAIDALGFFRECESRSGEAACHVMQAELLLATGKRDEALESAELALELAAQLGEEALKASAQSVINRLVGDPTAPAVREPHARGLDEPMAVSVAAPEAAAKPAGLNAEMVDAAIRDIAVTLMGVDTDSDTPFMDAGLDSLLSIQFRTMIAKTFDGMSLGTTLTFDYPTMRSLTDHIVDKSKTMPSDWQPSIG